ncbi:MAG: hypothetical protein AAGB04_12345 [Pseudomonadota bacterium]
MTEPKHSEKLELTPSLVLATAWVVLGLGLPLVYFGWTLYRMWLGERIEWGEMFVVGGVVTFMGGCLAASSIGTVLNRQPWLIVDKRTLHIPKVTKSPIPWEHISELKFRADLSGGDNPTRRNLYMIVELQQPALYPVKPRGALGRWLSWYYGTPYILDLESFADVPDDVVAQLRCFAPDSVTFSGDVG